MMGLLWCWAVPDGKEVKMGFQLVMNRPERNVGDTFNVVVSDVKQGRTKADNREYSYVEGTGDGGEVIRLMYDGIVVLGAMGAEPGDTVGIVVSAMRRGYPVYSPIGVVSKRKG